MAMAPMSASLDAAVVLAVDGAAVEEVYSRTRFLSRRRCCCRLSEIVEAVVVVRLVADSVLPALDSVVVRVRDVAVLVAARTVVVVDTVAVVEAVVSVKLSSVFDVSVAVVVVDGTGQWRAPRSHPAQTGQWRSTIACACAQASTAP
mmetsp:Transcript_104705/g.273350  ORF Transcript_104705/g.273350 Transcript_104705/m.273350 type:complete len:147 (-) Transcript_104705:358-798(-)